MKVNFIIFICIEDTCLNTEPSTTEIGSSKEKECFILCTYQRISLETLLMILLYKTATAGLYSDGCL